MRGISVVGIGKLGICVASIFAAKGYRVIGVDVNERTIRLVKELTAPNHETGLQEMMKRGEGRLTATNDFNYAILNSQISFVFVPTPSLPNGSYSVEYLKKALEEMSKVIKRKDDWHLVVIGSTVLPGTMDNVIKPILEEKTGKTCGEGFGLCYSPEFIALGSVLRDLTYPNIVLIGEYDSKSGDILSDVYQKVCANDPPICRMTPINAELTKIAFNSYVTMKVGFANTLADLCERIPGGDVDDITEALGLDSRIGSRFFKGGLGFGGPCLPRDNRALAFLADSLDCPVLLARTSDKVNNYQNERLLEKAASLIRGDGKIAVLGITYKPNTDFVDPSAGMALVLALVSRGMKVTIYDPAGLDNAKRLLGDKVGYASSIEECLKGSEVCIIATPWDEFNDLPTDILKRNGVQVVLDCWRILDRESITQQGIRYAAVGINEDILGSVEQYALQQRKR
ncbi:MAG: UDP-glucose dehydrogenase family protein [Nitrososphaerales archaeon]